MPWARGAGPGALQGPRAGPPGPRMCDKCLRRTLFSIKFVYPISFSSHFPNFPLAQTPFLTKLEKATPEIGNKQPTKCAKISMFTILNNLVYIYLLIKCLRQIPHVARGERHACKEDFLCRRCLRFFADVLRKGYRKGVFFTEKGAKRVQNGAKRVPKATKMEPKGSQNEPGTSKMEPCGAVSIFDAKGGGPLTWFWDPFWLHFGPKSIKNAIEKSLKNRYRKS